LMIRLKILPLFLSAILVFFVGCDIVVEGEQEAQPTSSPEIEILPYPVIINDVVIDSQPRSIVSLSPALTEIVFELGAGERLIGLCSYCDFPRDTALIPDVGGSARPDIDRIIELKPDLLLTSTPIAPNHLFAMEQHGIKTLLIGAPNDLEEFKRIYEGLGLVLEGLFTGAQLGEEQFSVILKACQNADVVNIGKFIYITEDFKIAANGTLEHAVFSCFGENAAQGLEGYVTAGELLELNPDIILLNNKYTVNDLSDNELFSSLRAVEDKNLIYIENIYFERPTSRIVTLIEKMISDFKRS